LTPDLSSWFPQKLGKVGEIDSDPPGFVFGELLSRRSPARLILKVEITKLLAIRIQHRQRRCSSCRLKAKDVASAKSDSFETLAAIRRASSLVSILVVERLTSDARYRQQKLINLCLRIEIKFPSKARKHCYQRHREMLANGYALAGTLGLIQDRRLMCGYSVGIISDCASRIGGGGYASDASLRA
jgi:hypothetical protein